MGSDQKRAFIAVLISGLILIAWQKFFPSPEAKKTDVAPTTTTVTETRINTPVSQDLTGENISYTSSLVVKNAGFEFEITNQLGIIQAKSPNEVFPFTSIVGDNNPYQVSFFRNNQYEVQGFTLTQQSESVISAQNDFAKVAIFLEDTGKLIFEVNASQPTKLQFIFHSSIGELEGGDYRRFALLDNGKLEHEKVKDGLDEVGSGSLKWAGIDHHYHLFSVVFPEKTPGDYRMHGNSLRVRVKESYQNFTYKMVFLKKEYEKLKSLGDNLHQSVDFGMFAIIAEPLLWALQKIYSFIPNYGIAIILLTLLIRLLLSPLQVSSFKSMKKMQVLAPEMQKLKEKYKDDPMKMQQETMALYKKAGANPLGGCLPLFLQMPVFFAFFTVLRNAVELVGAPFFGWITDLSVKDPYYVMPILMTIVMFLQQKMSPSSVSMDATQKKVMMFMPLIFGVVMLNYPAGLSLYMIVSMGFGVIQQMLIYRSKEA
ncbi:MAG: membrane protein insertase YidC [Halobacteriovoraceae bacterium]|nr:membrane protein insertase YidC [Halobacteriovoraceae bacterium]